MKFETTVVGVDAMLYTATGDHVRKFPVCVLTTRRDATLRDVLLRFSRCNHLSTSLEDACVDGAAGKLQLETTVRKATLALKTGGGYYIIPVRLQLAPEPP